MASESADPKPLDPELEEEFKRLNAKHKPAEPEEAGGFGPDELQGAVEDAADDREEELAAAARKAAKAEFAKLLAQAPSRETTEDTAAKFETVYLPAAEIVAKSKLVGVSPQDAALVFAYADAIGENGFQCLVARDLYILEEKKTGKRTLGMSAKKALERYRRRGGEIKYVEETPEHCVLEVCAGGSSHWQRFDFTWQEAETQELTSKRNWQTVPRDMMRARCQMRAIRATDPAALGGCYDPQVEFGENGKKPKRAKAKPKAAPRDAKDVLKDMEPEAPPAEEPEPPPPEQRATPDPKGARLGDWLLERIEAGRLGYGTVTAIQPEPWEPWTGDDRKGLKIKGFRALTDQGKPWPLDFETLSNPASKDDKKQWTVGARVSWRWDTNMAGGPAWRVEVAPDCKTYIARVKEVRPAALDPEPQAEPEPAPAPQPPAPEPPPAAPDFDKEKDFQKLKLECKLKVDRIVKLMGLTWATEALAPISRAAFGTEGDNYALPIVKATIADYDKLSKLLDSLDFLVENTPELATLPPA